MRILYVGNDLELLKFLHETLEPKVVRCPPSPMCRSFIKGINYDLILLEESERELTDFIRSAEINEKTPIVVHSSDSPENILAAIKDGLVNSLLDGLIKSS
jgi:hypothetical protein